MPTPILATKLYVPPPRQRAVARPRLFQRLDEGSLRKLTLISAPAGFGKTTLVSEWIAASAPSVAWLSLDTGDSNAARFLTYLSAALGQIAPDASEGVLDAFVSSNTHDEEFLTALINEIASFTDDFVLVLDDYHTIDSVDVHRSLSFMLENLPPQMHVIITTREDPPIPLARLRARGQLTELRAADLRFTPDEAGQFLSQVMGLALSADDIAALEKRTEGWIAGLQLAALSMQGLQDAHGFVSAFSGNNRYIVDYLIEEVLNHQSQEVREFLQQTSILDQLSGPLCDAVRMDVQEPDNSPNDMVDLAQTTRSQALLEMLEKDNLFVVPLDERRNWYRYHHLFSDVLRAHLQHDQPDLVRILHRRASQWYENNGLRADGIRHALAGEDYCRAAALIELAWPEMDQSFQPSTWLAWKTALPDEVVRNRPVLTAGHAWAMLDAGEMETGESYLQAAEALLKAPSRELIVEDEEQFQKLPASIATARAYHAQALGDGAGTVRYGRRALDLLPADDHVRRGPADALISLAYWANGQLEEAAQALMDAMAEFELAGQLSFAISGTFGLADIRLAQGRLRQAEHVYQRSLRLAVRDGAPVARGAAYLYLGLSEVRREQGDLNAAARLMAKSKALNEQPPLTNWQYRYYLDQARIMETRGELDTALALLDEAARHYVRTPVPDLRPIPAMKARLWLLQGRIDMALSWASTAGVTADDELDYLREFEHMTLARTLVAQYEQQRSQNYIRDAQTLLRRLLHDAEENHRNGSAIEILILLALAQHSAGDVDAALVSLGRALGLAEPEGYLRVFVDEGPVMAELLASWKGRRAGQSAYVEELLSAFTGHESEDASPVHAPTGQQPVDPLTDRELEVLQLVAEGLTNREIGERLYLALDTVKGHNRRIFGKLQASTRTEAVSRAREARLL